MITPTRRELLKVAAAAAMLPGPGGPARVAAQAQVRQDDLLRFEPKGQVTILHTSDGHAQLLPVYFREPSVNLGVGKAKGLVPHLSGEALLTSYGIAPGSLEAYMLSSVDFAALARKYGRVGGMDRTATLIKAIRAERGEARVLLLDGGDTLTGSYTALKSKGADMLGVMESLGVEATTGHWEFTLGAQRIAELFGDRERKGLSKVPFLAGNIRDTEFDEPVFHSTRHFERGGVRIAVIGQAFPYTPIANPRWMIPKWSFGIREPELRKAVGAARARGAEIVVLLSHNGFDVDRKLASRVAGVDVVLTAHTHDALPAPVKVGRTLLIASGSAGKFLSRLDLDVGGGRVTDYSYGLIPVLADAIAPDADMARRIADIRGPHADFLATPLAETEDLLFRRGNFAGTLDDLICQALLEERDAELCFSPGFRWGNSLLPGDRITWEDVYNATAITYPACYRSGFRGETIKAILEDIADNLFNQDPYYQQGGDMVRVGGIGFTIHVDAAMGQRISGMHLLASGAPIEPGREYVVAGWASVNEGTEGPAIWDVVGAYLKRRGIVRPGKATSVRVVRAD